MCLCQDLKKGMAIIGIVVFSISPFCNEEIRTIVEEMYDAPYSLMAYSNSSAGSIHITTPSTFEYKVYKLSTDFQLKQKEDV